MKRNDNAYRKAMSIAAKVSAGAFVIGAISIIGIVLSALMWSVKYDITENSEWF